MWLRLCRAMKSVVQRSFLLSSLQSWSDGVVLDDMEACEEANLISYTSDILAGGLDVIFCGLNPALTAAVAGHNFSNGTNRFWTVLHLAGFH
jgi:hypothetical protein